GQTAIHLLSAPSFALHVLSGLHADATCEIGDRPVTIGSGSDADITLLDEGIQPSHLAVAPLPGGQFRCTALAEGVIINDYVLDSGKSHNFTLPIDIRIASVPLSITDTATAETGHTSAFPIFRLPALFSAQSLTRNIVICVAGILGLLLLEGIFWHSASSPVQPASSPSTGSEAMSDLPARKQNMALSDHDLGESVIHELRNHDLFGLAVRVSGGVVTVSGAVPHERLTAFRDAEQWFDASYGQQYTWISDVKESPNKVLSLPIQSIWLG
ncbi:hypothetical protein AD936_02905, partial [Gluconobacter japonicus]